MGKNLNQDSRTGHVTCGRAQNDLHGGGQQRCVGARGDVAGAEARLAADRPGTSEGERGSSV